MGHGEVSTRQIACEGKGGMTRSNQKGFNPIETSRSTRTGKPPEVVPGAGTLVTSWRRCGERRDLSRVH
jgi:hypothetical protein